MFTDTQHDDSVQNARQGEPPGLGGRSLSAGKRITCSWTDDASLLCKVLDRLGRSFFGETSKSSRAVPYELEHGHDDGFWNARQGENVDLHAELSCRTAEPSMYCPCVCKGGQSLYFCKMLKCVVHFDRRDSQ
jgi:hypothetical protein